jgi:hypothetical protein
MRNYGVAGGAKPLKNHTELYIIILINKKKFVITTEKTNKIHFCYSFFSNNIIIMVLNNMSIISRA